MFATHVTKELSAYCHGEVASDKARRIAEHLIGCSRCRTQFEEIKLGVKLAGQMPQASAPDSLWTDLQARLQTHPEVSLETPGAAAEPGSSHKQSALYFKTWRPVFAVAAALLLVVGVGAFWLYPRESRPSWEVARLGGAPRIGAARISGKGRLAVGQWLETDADSRAQIEVGSIGQVEIDPNTRVRLVETKPTEHRLELAQGKMSARIWAPPRLFFVDTPAGVAADLGCAYTLEVDDKGVGLLHVTSGWVALELKDRESMVPAGASCATRPGVGPGTPYFDDASEAFRKSLASLDFDPHPELVYFSDLDRILAEARPRDTLTLWHLLDRVEGEERAAVYDRLAVLVPPPDGVTRDGVLQLNEQMLQLWKDQLATVWSDGATPGVQKAGTKVWGGGPEKLNGLKGKK